MPRNKRLGATAEDRAADYLSTLGYAIVTRNYYARYGEIDIVAMDGDTIVFVEVRERRAYSAVPAEESIDVRKKERLILAAEHYLAEVHGKEAACRIDLLALDEDGVTHYMDVLGAV